MDSLRETTLKLIKNISGQKNIIAVPREFIRYTGDVESALLLSQLLYWTDKVPDSWIYKTYNEWQDEICLKEYQVRKARKKLEQMGILETKVAKANGNPTVHYRIKEDKFLDSFLQNLKKRICENGRNEPANFEETLTKTTTETTTKDMHVPQTLFGEPEDGGTKKGNNTCVYTPVFEEFWRVYPRKQEKKAAFMKWKACLRKGINPNLLITAAKNYAEYVRQNGTAEQFIKHATTFLGPSEVYLEWANRKPEPDSYPYGTAEETRRRLGWD